jgi:carbon-monoxide dehydrogenase medium subunit
MRRRSRESPTAATTPNDLLARSRLFSVAAAAVFARPARTVVANGSTMRPFELYEPESLADALGLLDRNDASVRPAGGCTALMLMMKAGVLEPRRLVSLRRIEPRYCAIEQQAQAIRIGAQVTLSQLEQSEAIRSSLPSVSRTLRRLANVRVRNVATLGGNLAHADPHMDLPALLSALDAEVLVQGPAGARSVRVGELISGYMETTLAGDELIAEVCIPIRKARRALYRKVTTRSADDWPALGIAVALDVGRDGELADTRVVVSAAVDRPTRLVQVEALLNGARPDDVVLARAGDAAAAQELIGDQHGSAAYKRELLRVHLQRALREATAVPS